MWRQVANHLRTAGHEVFTPTLTGFGERAHLANPEISLDTHIQDIMGVIECEDLQQLILVGYSYGGMVVTGVSERVPERVLRLVYLDAVVPNDGQTLHDIVGPEVTRLDIDLAREKGDGWRIPLIDYPPRWQPHPLKTGMQHLEVKNPATVRIPRAYIHCTIRRKDAPLVVYMPALDRAAEEAKQKG